MDRAELDKKLELHKKWLNNEPGGERADLQGANLQGAKNIPDYVGSVTSITAAGNITGWKKCQNDVIVKLLIPAKAKRSNATGRKCRAEYAKVVEVIGGDGKTATTDRGGVYTVGKIVKPDSWDEDRWTECSHGIHFFITRYEAEYYV